MIVFGVCALGVGCLYLAPSMARSPDQIALPQPTDGPTSSPVGVAGSVEPQPAATGVSRTAGPIGQTNAQPRQGIGEPRSARLPVQRRPTPAATAFDPTSAHDHEAPGVVLDLDSAEVNADRLVLHWAAATDNVGVIGYRLWLNGFEVATTAETHVSLSWFNDDDRQHVVQIRAIDAAGNQSATSPTLVISRPEPEPGPTPTPPAGPDPTPTPGPASSDSPSPTPPPPSPTVEGSPDPDGPQ